MTEAEVILQLALYYIKNNLTQENVTVSIDGAHVKTNNKIHFDIFGFLQSVGLRKINDREPQRWQGEYTLDGYDSRIIITSKSGKGDVRVTLTNGEVVFAECKKGKTNRSGREYPLMREAIGQLMTSQALSKNCIPLVAVPNTNKARALAERWSKFDQIKQLGIRFALLDENGEITFY